MKRSGNAFLNMPVLVAAARSASNTTISGSFARILYKRCAIAFTCCNFLFAHINYASSFLSAAVNSARAAACCSSFGALPCQETLFSMNETPLPLTDFCTITLGLPLQAFAFSNASAICSKSCASMTMTFQPKAANFSGIGSGDKPRKAYRQFADRYNPPQPSDCQDGSDRQTLQPPTPCLPQFLRRPEWYIHDNPFGKALPPSPYRMRRKLPVLRIRYSYRRPAYPSYQDVPANKSQRDAVSKDPPPENSPRLQARRKAPAHSVLSIKQNDRDRPNPVFGIMTHYTMI